MKPDNHTIVGLITCLIVLASAVAWPLNVYRLAKCDFSNEGSWKGEVIHGIGVVTPTYLVTAWSNWDD